MNPPKTTVGSLVSRIGDSFKFWNDRRCWNGTPRASIVDQYSEAFDAFSGGRLRTLELVFNDEPSPVHKIGGVIRFECAADDDLDRRAFSSTMMEFAEKFGYDKGIMACMEGDQWWFALDCDHDIVADDAPFDGSINFDRYYMILEAYHKRMLDTMCCQLLDKLEDYESAALTYLDGLGCEFNEYADNWSKHAKGILEVLERISSDEEDLWEAPADAVEPEAAQADKELTKLIERIYKHADDTISPILKKDKIEPSDIIATAYARSIATQIASTGRWGNESHKKLLAMLSILFDSRLYYMANAIEVCTAFVNENADHVEATKNHRRPVDELPKAKRIKFSE